MPDHPEASVPIETSAGATWKRLTDSLPIPKRAEDRDDILWQEFAAVFVWYDKAATRNRIAYQVLKLAALTAGAAVTVLAAISAPAAVTATVAGIIVVMEGAQQMFQFHPNWLSYRGTAETLRQHAFLYVADIVPYADADARRDRLAEVLKDVTSRENTNWSHTMQQTASRIDANQ
jgi:hypothetical protein